MELTITQHGDDEGRCTFVLAGSIDLTTRQSLIDAGTEVFGRGASLTLDMAAVEFVDSTGIGALLELERAAASHDSRLTISQRSARVTRVLEVTGLDRLWAPAPATAEVGPGDR